MYCARMLSGGVVASLLWGLEGLRRALLKEKQLGRLQMCLHLLTHDIHSFTLLLTQDYGGRITSLDLLRNKQLVSARLFD